MHLAKASTLPPLVRSLAARQALTSTVLPAGKTKEAGLQIQGITIYVNA